MNVRASNPNLPNSALIEIASSFSISLTPLPALRYNLPLSLRLSQPCSTGRSTREHLKPLTDS